MRIPTGYNATDNTAIYINDSSSGAIAPPSGVTLKS